MSDKNLPASLFTPRTFQEAREFAQFIAKTKFIPDAYKDKPDEILACIQYGSEVGLSPMQSLNNISVINGRPSMWGDVLLALVQQSGKLEYIKETETTETATCEVKRKGDPESRTVKWSVQDTARAGLTNRDSHKNYPARMRQMRARGFALRDKFADVLKGLIAREEAIDITPPKNDAGELSPEETPRARVEVKRDEPIDDPNSFYPVVGRQEAEAEEGAALAGSGSTPEDTQSAPNGDYPTADEVKSAFLSSPLAPATKFARIELVIPDFKQRGYKLDGPERKKVMEALRG